MNEQRLEIDLDQKLEKIFFNATCFILVFILYASLLPYNISNTYSSVSFSDFWNTLNFSEPSAEQGEWIGHVIFNALLTFLACLYCVVSKNKKRWYQVLGFIFIFGFFIEYFQMFIGPRGTSLSDIYANVAGMAFGVLALLIFGKFAIETVRYYLQHQTLPIEYTKKLYFLFVVAVILFPFDFYMNNLQLQIAFAAKGYPLFENDLGQGVGLFSFAGAFLLTFPLGVLYRLSSISEEKKGKSILLKMSLLFLLLEILQFFEVSGQSSLLSLFAKIFGFFLGFGIARFLQLKEMFDFFIRIRLILFALVPVYIWIVLKVKGLSFDIPASATNLAFVFEQISLLPFRYYVDVGSGDALLSFLLNFVIFVPLGGLAALHYIARFKYVHMRFSQLVLIGIIGSIILEITVFIWGLKKPDITNIIISGMAFPLGYYLLMMLNKGLDDDQQHVE